MQYNILNFQKVKSKWINSGNANPTDEYFLEKKINIWLTYCETLHFAHDKVTDIVLNGFDANNLEKSALQRIAGLLLLFLNFIKFKNL